MTTEDPTGGGVGRKEKREENMTSTKEVSVLTPFQTDTPENIAHEDYTRCALIAAGNSIRKRF